MSASSILSPIAPAMGAAASPNPATGEATPGEFAGAVQAWTRDDAEAQPQTPPAQAAPSRLERRALMAQAALHQASENMGTGSGTGVAADALMVEAETPDVVTAPAATAEAVEDVSGADKTQTQTPADPAPPVAPADPQIAPAPSIHAPVAPAAPAPTEMQAAPSPTTPAADAPAPAAPIDDAATADGTAGAEADSAPVAAPAEDAAETPVPAPRDPASRDTASERRNRAEAPSNAAASRTAMSDKAAITDAPAEARPNSTPGAAPADAAPKTAERPVPPPATATAAQGTEAAARTAVEPGPATSADAAPLDAQADLAPSQPLLDAQTAAQTGQRDLGLSQLSRATVETTAHLAAQIIKKLEGRSTRFDMALTPEGLGRVDVSLEIDSDGRLAARLAFDNPAAATDMRARADELRRQLQDAGFQLTRDSLEFSDRNPSSGFNGGGAFDRAPDRRAFAGAARLAAEADTVLPPPGAWASLSLTPDRVDMKV